MNCITDTEIIMHVSCRALYHIVLIGLVISAPGILLDADHWWASLVKLDDHRWLHYSIASTPAVFVLLCLLWSLVATAFTVGWIDMVQPTMPEHKTPQMLSPLMYNVAETREISTLIDSALPTEYIVEESAQN
jgi:hypothetical protein